MRARAHADPPPRGSTPTRCPSRALAARAARQQRPPLQLAARGQTAPEEEGAQGQGVEGQESEEASGPGAVLVGDAVLHESPGRRFGYEAMPVDPRLHGPLHHGVNEPSRTDLAMSGDPSHWNEAAKPQSKAQNGALRHHLHGHLVGDGRPRRSQRRKCLLRVALVESADGLARSAHGEAALKGRHGSGRAGGPCPAGLSA
mmetsp:Transcript_76899/g.204109  ORF Transcript_76899/g.204109 Transcript_76899/m.204109 type:complete len:201 (+) Transcript_76899:1-603(+)